MVRVNEFARKIDSVALVGAGALGSEIARSLLLARFERVLVIDPDTIEPRNLLLSRLYRDAVARGSATPGEPKAAVLVRLAQEAGLHWTAHQAEIADVGLAMLRGVSLIVSAADSTLARAETAYAARTLRLPVIDAGVHGEATAQGRVSWFPAPLTAACPLCGLNQRRRAELLAYAASASLGCAAPPEFPSMSGPAPIVDCVAGAVLTWLEHPPASDAAFAWRLRADHAHAPDEISLARSLDCPWHDLPVPEHLVTLAADETPASMLPHSDAVLELPWPICARARCRNCRHTVEPWRRTAYVRRRLACTHCGVAGALDPEVQISTIRPSDPAAQRTARQLGLPDQHLYRVRAAFLPHHTPASA